MNWTDKPPTKPGWYWNRTKNGKASPLLVAYSVWTGTLVVVSLDMSVDKCGGEWAGPIPEPTGEYTFLGRDISEMIADPANQSRMGKG